MSQTKITPGRKKTCPCGEKSIPGLAPDVSMCQQHYSALMFGTGNAHLEALTILNKSRAAYAKLVRSAGIEVE